MLIDELKEFVISQKKKGVSRDVQSTGFDAIITGILDEVYGKEES